jgi:hypothetical protein
VHSFAWSIVVKALIRTIVATVVVLGIAVVALEWKRTPTSSSTPSRETAAQTVKGTMSPIDSPSTGSASHPTRAVASPQDEGFIEPAGPLKDNIDHLKQQALAGSNRAAYYLAIGLFECRINNPLVGRGDPSFPMMPERERDCRGIGADDLNAFKQWLQLAADRGHADSQMIYSTLAINSFTLADAVRDPDAIVDYKRRSMDYLNRAAANGNPGALSQLSTVYSAGIVAPKNLELAYAYELAFLQATGVPTSVMANQLSAQLTEGGQERARTLAQKIYSSTIRK